MPSGVAYQINYLTFTGQISKDINKTRQRVKKLYNYSKQVKTNPLHPFRLKLPQVILYTAWYNLPKYSQQED